LGKDLRSPTHGFLEVSLILEIESRSGWSGSYLLRHGVGEVAEETAGINFHRFITHPHKKRKNA
jgi:hypothetical protein